MLRTNPAGADLGSVVVGQPSPELLFDVENVSLAPTGVARVEVTGAHAFDFAITSNSCARKPLNPRATCSVGVTFTPTASGRRTALVRIVTPTGQYTTMVAAGDGRYTPQFQLGDTEVRAGTEMLAGGSGFPPNTPVSILFGDGAENLVTTTTGFEGGLLVVGADAGR